jgi:carbamoyl-phosphate synthase large subunit
MTLENKRVFVSGGAGMIGRELCPLLRSLGAIVMVGDLKPAPVGWIGEIIYQQGDLNYLTRGEIEEFQPEIYIHLVNTLEQSTLAGDGWFEQVMQSQQLSHHLMQTIMDLPSIRRVLFASSYLVYDPQLYHSEKSEAKVYSIKETDPVYPQHPNGLAKLAQEFELGILGLAKRDVVGISIVRLFRRYGSGSHCEISKWIRSLIQGKEIVVRGKDSFFDYVHAVDIARGLSKLAACKEALGIVNLGTGKARKVSEVLEVLRPFFPAMKYTEVDTDLSFEASQADISLFVNFVGWRPQLSMEEVIPGMIEQEKSAHGAEQMSFGVLVTSISRKVPMLKAIRNAAKKIGTNIRIFGGDNDHESLGKYFVDSFWHMPKTSGLTPENLIDFCTRNNIKAIIPSRDGELHFWSAAQIALRDHGIHVMISPPEGIEICVDKLSFSQKLVERGFPVIPSYTSVNEVQSSAVVVKERFGAGSLNMALNVSKEAALAHATKLNAPIFQPFIKGKEYSVDVYIDKKGRVKGAIARSRDVVVNGESQITTTLSNPKLEALCRNLVNALPMYGHIVLQVLMDENENLHVIECNSRFGGASTLSIASGLDSFYWFMLEANQVDLDSYPFTRSKVEKKQVRFPEDLITDGTGI